MNHRGVVRIVLAGIIVAAATFIFFSFATSAFSQPTTSAAADEASKPVAERQPIVPPTNDVTVVTGQGFGGGHALIAFDPEGRVLFHDDRYDSYLDVDPSPEGNLTVILVASETIPAAKCNATVTCQVDIIERINLSTGNRERLHTFVAPERVSEKTHDADRLDDSRLLVGGLPYDRVYVVNTTTGILEWQWNVDSALPRSSGSGGAGWPKDWTHLNDVERLPDGRYMTSLRNQDRVVFIDPKTGMQPDWTLGCEDCHEVLYEQHNPDYIPESRGGPSVIVADSHNDRIVEFQRVNGSWKPSWTWSDERLAWPRDADRLPNGNTLIVDSNGDRVIEVNESGEIVWSFEADSIYDVERLGTGDESTGGYSATTLGLTSRTESGRAAPGLFTSVKDVLRGVFSIKTRNAVAFVLPDWMWWTELFAISFGLLTAVIWSVLELYWRNIRPHFRWPVYLE